MGVLFLAGVLVTWWAEAGGNPLLSALGLDPAGGNMEGKEIRPPGFRYVRGEQAAEPLMTGDEGASVAFLTFDRDALEGGITGDGLAVEAAEAMARAI